MSWSKKFRPSYIDIFYVHSYPNQDNDIFVSQKYQFPKI